MTKTAAPTDKKSASKTPKTSKKGEPAKAAAAAAAPEATTAQTTAAAAVPKVPKTSRAKQDKQDKPDPQGKPEAVEDSASPLSNASVTIIRDGVVLSRDDRVRHAAYLRAEARNFEPGHEVEDWLAAEAEIDGKSTPT